MRMTLGYSKVKRQLKSRELKQSTIKQIVSFNHSPYFKLFILLLEDFVRKITGLIVYAILKLKVKIRPSKNINIFSPEYLTK